MGMYEALFGRQLRTTERGMMLDRILRLRDLQACITPYCYAWFRFKDDIKHEQKRLAEFRRTRAALVRGAVL